MSLRPFRRGLLLLAFTGAIALASGTGQALAAPVWHLGSGSAPSYLPPSGEGEIITTALNLGESEIRASAAHPITITDVLPAALKVPAGVTGASIEAYLEARPNFLPAYRLQCSLEEASRKEVRCQALTAEQSVVAYHELKLVIPVQAQDAATREENTVSVSGGTVGAGAGPSASLSRALTISTAPTPFGIEHYELTPENEDGTTDTQAGTHPFQVTTTLDLNQTFAANAGTAQLVPQAPALLKNLNLELPPGLLGDPQAVAQCSALDFSTVGENNVNACPNNTVIGVAAVTLNLPVPALGVYTEAVPVFNLVPAPGEPARFGFEDTKVPVILDTAVRTTGDYGVDVTISNTSQAAQLLSSTVTLWGAPYSETHDGSRGWACLVGGEVNGEACTPAGRGKGSPFLTLPTSCLGELSSQIAGSSWTGQSLSGAFAFERNAGEPLASLEDCPAVPFTPAIAVAPVEEGEGAAPGAVQQTGSTPAGLNVDVKMPVEADGVAEGMVRQARVTLPAGVQLSPSAANGLQACSEDQVGFEGPAGGVDPLSPGAPAPMRFSAAAALCPAASKIGVVRIKSPDVAQELEGSVFVAAQEANPFGSLFAVYLVAEDREAGVLVKLAGDVSVDEETGQITTTFTDTPQVPFEELRLHFFEGPRASLSTPALCGDYATGGVFSSWSGATSEPASAPFSVTSGPGGMSCSYPLPFSPSLTAGAGVLQAGAFTPFTLTLAHPDGDQSLDGVSVRLPEGVAALLSTVTPCPAPEAGGEWTCGADSLIGHSIAWAGLGSEPYPLPGSVYLTTGYGGSPFGLLVQTPAVAGPFDLGVVNVRSQINVNPETAAVTITSQPFPQYVKGVPAALKDVQVTVDRTDFEFNPTKCSAASVGATLDGVEGAAVSLPSSFEVAGCENLPFAPVLTASTAGLGSKSNGTSFRVVVQSGGVGAGGVVQSNIAKVFLTLPKALSTRDSTLKLACLEATFNANPASCPAGSAIGSATIHTPVLRSALTGPAYLVSHGGAEFPDVEFVLQGEGVTIVLDGKTDIKNGITYSRFESTPDAPFTTFETVFPAGPDSIFSPNAPGTDRYNVCEANLAMPTEITAQDGAVLRPTTRIAATGCDGVLASRTKLTRARLLKKALKACRRDKNSHKRHTCERRARGRYGPKPAPRKVAKALR